jgi:hypothetical protein
MRVLKSWTYTVDTGVSLEIKNCCYSMVGIFSFSIHSIIGVYTDSVLALD